MMLQKGVHLKSLSTPWGTLYKDQLKSEVYT